MTDIDLDELEQLAKAATPKWYSTGGIFDPGTDHETVNMWGETPPGMQSGYCFGRCPRHDGQFIAAASPRTILALIARIRYHEECARDWHATAIERAARIRKLEAVVEATQRLLALRWVHEEEP